MKKIFILSIILTFSINAGLFGNTEEEQRIGKENLTKAIMGKQDPRIQALNRENNYMKKILRKHNIDYKTIINTKKRGGKIKNITRQLITPEKEQIKALEQINKELKRLLEVNYIEYKLPKRDYRTVREKLKQTFVRGVTQIEPKTQKQQFEKQEEKKKKKKLIIKITDPSVSKTVSQ